MRMTTLPGTRTRYQVPWYYDDDHNKMLENSVGGHGTWYRIPGVSSYLNIGEMLKLKIMITTTINYAVRSRELFS